MVGENGRNPEKNLPRPHFVHHETHMEGPRCELGTPAVGGERLTACAMRPLPLFIIYIKYYMLIYVMHATKLLSILVKCAYTCAYVHACTHKSFVVCK